MATGTVCLIGDPPHPTTREVLKSFSKLLHDVFGRELGFEMAGRDVSSCRLPARTYVRLYNSAPPHWAYNQDLRVLDRAYGIGLPKDRDQVVMSPGQASVYFGKRGTAAHLLIKQSAKRSETKLEHDFYATILIEELFQTFSFGQDILKFDRKAPFVSKLQEHPVNLRYLPWESEGFMRGLLESNPRGLCAFDIFMLHALAETQLVSVNSPEFLNFIERHFEQLLQQTAATLNDPGFRPILDRNCGELPS